jgi:hypothetical protein
MKTLYHGTDMDSAKEICITQLIDVKRGSPRTDFGQGFYTTNNFDSAVRWANRKADARRNKPAVVTVIFDEESAKPIVEYFSDDLRWGRFVINNRNGMEYIRNISFQDNNIDARYQITCGRIADGAVIDISDDLKDSGKMLMSLEEILNLEYPLQYAFHTKASIQFIKKMTYRPV